MYATNYLERGFLNILKNITFTAPEEVYIGLYLTNPGEEGMGTEIQYSGYERQLIKFSNAAEENGVIQIKNLTQIDFPQSPTNAGKATYIGVSDSKMSGNMLAYGKLVEDLEVSEGESPVLMAGEIIMFSNGDLSKSYKKKLLNTLRGESIMGITPYVALYNGNPDKGGSEIIADNYARVMVDFKAPDENQSGQTVISNNNEVVFNRPTTDWGVWNYTAIMDRDKQGEAIWLYDRGISKELKKGYMPNAKKDTLKFALN